MCASAHEAHSFPDSLTFVTALEPDDDGGQDDALSSESLVGAHGGRSRPAQAAPRPAKPESSFLRDKIAPTMVTFLVLTVGGTLITSYFQFNQWRQATALSRSQESLKRGDETAQRLFSLLSERHYYTWSVIGTW